MKNGILRFARSDIQTPTSWSPRFWVEQAEIVSPLNKGISRSWVINDKVVMERTIPRFATLSRRKPTSHPYIRGDWPEEVRRILSTNGEVIGWSQSTLDQMRERLFTYSYPAFGRMDLVMMNVYVNKGCCPTCDRDGWMDNIQYFIDPAPYGNITFRGDETVFSVDDIKWAVDESARLWALGEKDPIVKWALTSVRPEGFDLDAWKMSNPSDLKEAA